MATIIALKFPVTGVCQWLICRQYVHLPTLPIGRIHLIFWSWTMKMSPLQGFRTKLPRSIVQCDLLHPNILQRGLLQDRRAGHQRKIFRVQQRWQWHNRQENYQVLIILILLQINLWNEEKSCPGRCDERNSLSPQRGQVLSATPVALHFTWWVVVFN